jgi:DnaK suppressor protein
MVKKRKAKARHLTFPQKLVLPVGLFLEEQLAKLKKRRADIEKEDPFKDERRITDNAAPDTEAEEQFGHARTSAIKEQLDRKIIQTRKALTRIRVGKYGICEKCNQMIDTDRLVVYPEATLCVKCGRKKK